MKHRRIEIITKKSDRHPFMRLRTASLFNADSNSPQLQLTKNIHEAFENEIKKIIEDFTHLEHEYRRNLVKLKNEKNILYIQSYKILSYIVASTVFAILSFLSPYLSSSHEGIIAQTSLFALSLVSSIISLVTAVASINTTKKIANTEINLLGEKKNFYINGHQIDHLDYKNPADSELSNIEDHNKKVKSNIEDHNKKVKSNIDDIKFLYLGDINISMKRRIISFPAVILLAFLASIVAISLMATYLAHLSKNITTDFLANSYTKFSFALQFACFTLTTTLIISTLWIYTASMYKVASAIYDKECEKSCNQSEQNASYQDHIKYTTDTMVEEQEGVDNRHISYDIDLEDSYNLSDHFVTHKVISYKRD